MSSHAIQTRYNGYHFRSRLEARWAVWLDTLGIAYTYELQGFDLDGEAYLPDFWLPGSPDRIRDSKPQVGAGCWLEIKPAPLTDNEEKLLSNLALHTHCYALAFAGDPWPGEFALYGANPKGGVHFRPPTLCPMCEGVGYDKYPADGEWRGIQYSAWRAHPCGWCQTEHPDRSICWMVLYSFFCHQLDNTPDQEQVNAAFQRARAARFEHGEHP